MNENKADKMRLAHRIFRERMAGLQRNYDNSMAIERRMVRKLVALIVCVWVVASAAIGVAVWRAVEAQNDLGLGLNILFGSAGALVFASFLALVASVLLTVILVKEIEKHRNMMRMFDGMFDRGQKQIVDEYDESIKSAEVEID